MIPGDHFERGCQPIKVFSERDPSKLPWKEHEVDVVAGNVATAAAVCLFEARRQRR